MFLFPSPKTYRTYAWYLYGFMVVNFEKKVVMWWSFVLSLSMVSCVQINWKKWKTKYKKKKLKLDVIKEIKENIHFMILIRIYCRDLK